MQQDLLLLVRPLRRPGDRPTDYALPRADYDWTDGLDPVADPVGDRARNWDMRILAGRVATGIALLDRRVPDWWRAGHPNLAIDVDRLDMARETDCVLGQLFGTYTAGLVAVEVSSWSAQAHGFDVDRPVSRTELTAAWRSAILARRAGTTSSTTPPTS